MKEQGSFQSWLEGSEMLHLHQIEPQPKHSMVYNQL